MAGHSLSGWMLAGATAVLLSGCMGETGGSADGMAPAAGPAGTTRLIERDVEAPQVFQTSDQGLWDGRPSLGGVWVAYPNVKDPERVIIRNPANGKFVIGALFRREREMPGPKLQVSSDAAAALGMLAGAPVKLDVTALRREEVAAATGPAAPILDAAETIASETLPPAGPAARPAAKPVADVAAVAAGALAATPAPRVPPAQAAAPAVPSGRNLIQIGIFSVEANAKGAAEQLRRAGAKADVRQETSQGKTFWRVTAGPAEAGGRDALLAKVKGLGFKDAYFVSR